MLILCTGASGIVGWNFVNAALENGHRVIAVRNGTALPPRANLTDVKMDLEDFEAIQRLVLDNFPDAVVHCAAVASPDDVEKDPARAEKINVALTRHLAHLANHVNARLIHLSTDMVFDGTAAPYKNTDTPMPMNLYGQTKLLAEKEVLKIMAASSVVLRITHVSGNSLTQKRSLHEKFMLRWMAGEKIPLAANDVRKPCSARRLADVLCEILERPNLSGIYHFCGMDALSRHDIGRRICGHFGLDPDEFVERADLPSPIDLSLNMGCLAARIKTASTPFEGLLEEMQVPAECDEWLFQKTGRRQIKRFKL